MAVKNAAATLNEASNFNTDWGSATLTVQQGSTVLATHTMNGFTESNNGANGVATAAAVTDATIATTGTADTVLLTQGAREINITNDVTLSTQNYVSGETSRVVSLSFTFPAS